jgi:hypothetical protein
VNACRILDRLWEAEKSEPDVHLRSDYRQAFICVSLASRGEPQPFITSSYRIFGVHPDNVWPEIMAKRKAKLGKEFPDWFDQAGNLKPDIPGKKPAPYVPDEQVERAINERLAAVLMFPKPEVRSANVVKASGLRRQKSGKGTLYTMPKTARPAKRQPLRILPA